MRKYPTPWQYLVDIVAQGRLKAAYASNDPKVRAAADKNFRGLVEDEVVFAPVGNKNGKLVYSMTSKVRGFAIKELAFATGSLTKMVQQNANLMVKHDDLDSSQITGFYFCEDADQLHLLVNPNSNIHEALKMTGYEFQPEHYSVVMYAGRDAILKADGVVSIAHPVIAGEVFISYVQPVAPTEKRGVIPSFIPEDEPTYQSSLQDEPVLFAKEAYDPSAPVVGEEAGIPGYVAPSFAELTDPAVEKSVAVQEAAKVVPVSTPVEEETVVEEKPVVQQQKKKK